MRRRLMFSFIQVPLCFKGQRLSEADACQIPRVPLPARSSMGLAAQDSHRICLSLSSWHSLHFSYQSVSLWAPAALSSRL